MLRRLQATIDLDAHFEDEQESITFGELSLPNRFSLYIYQSLLVYYNSHPLEADYVRFAIVTSR